MVVSFDDWKEGKVASSENQFPVILPPRSLKVETVSSRLRQTLIHPDKIGVLLGVRYTPDGRRLLAGHYRSGVVQVWDAATGRQLTRIESGNHLGISDYFTLSPDGKLLYVYRNSATSRGVTKDGKRLIHVDYSGDVRVWQVATGTLQQTLDYPPPRGIWDMQLSPDGATLVTFEGISGDFALPSKPGIASKPFLSLWDARTGKRLMTLPKEVQRACAFSPDGKTLLADSLSEDLDTNGTFIVECATGKIVRQMPFPTGAAHRRELAFSPDGKLLVGQLIYRKTDPREHVVKFWDFASGREVASFEEDKHNRIRLPLFSPDGKQLLITSFSYLPTSQPKKLLLIDMATRRLVKKLGFGDKTTIRQPVYSPDGKWIAVIVQDVREHYVAYYEEDLVQLPQPRIHLIEAATGDVRETIVVPPGVAVSLCFSPDGKTLASSGDGRVLLWDMTTPPGQPK